MIPPIFCTSTQLYTSQFWRLKSYNKTIAMQPAIFFSTRMDLDTFDIDLNF